jgi:hypothetical protein
MSDPYSSPFPDQYAGQRGGGNAQYPDHPVQYADADQYGQYPEQYPEHYPTRGQPTAAYPAEHYSSQAYVAPQTPTRRGSAGQFPETGPIDRERDRDPGRERDSRPPKKTGTPLGRIVLGVFLGLVLWSIVMGVVALVVLGAVAGKLENRLDDLNNNLHATSTSTGKTSG